MALLPLLWLGWLKFRKRDPGVAWWWLVGVFVVSWLADTAAFWVDPWVIGAVYPVSQAALIGAVFLPRRDAVLLIVVLAVVGIVDLLWHGVAGPDILLRVTAWGAATAIVYHLPQLGRLRIALIVYLGGSLLAWMLYNIWPGWRSYLIYQTIRLAGILLFCWAATSPLPQLRVMKTASG